MLMKTRQPFEKVVAEHRATVLRVCRTVVGPADADDAWSATFLAALRAYPGLPGDANVEAWLVTIAHRKAVDLVRARRRRQLVTDKAAGAPTAEAMSTGGSSAEEPSMTGVPDSSELEVWDHVKGLPDKQRQVIAYRYLAGLSYAEVAGIVGGTSA
ncbi:MAG TPA: RNA polymerase sigma factor, partial [Thermoleophilia bacterium]|nr:RNA polymerase sigma factor [Thermoleophilia bacterium]